MLGGSLSNGLIANANSVQVKSSQKLNEGRIEDGKSDRQIVKGAKEIYGYGIMGFYENGARQRNIDEYLKENLSQEITQSGVKEETKSNVENIKLNIDHINIIIQIGFI